MIDTPKARSNRKRYARVRAAVLEAYGDSECQCCGETREKFLTLDHFFNNGTAERAKNGWGVRWFTNLLRQGFPPVGLRVLCYNCNLGRAKNGNICPHEEEREADIDENEDNMVSEVDY